MNVTPTSAAVLNPSRRGARGPARLGKTTLAHNVAYQALVAGHRMITTSDLLLDHDAAEQTRKLDRRLRHWANLRLPLLDELAYIR